MKKNDDLLKKLKKEIDELEYIVNHTKRYEAKRKLIKCLKLTKEYIKRTSPSILAVSTLTGVFIAGGDIPFYRNDAKYYLNNKYEFDNHDNYHISSQYNSYDKAVNRIFISSKWEYKDNEYTRTVKEYSGDSFKKVFKEFSHLINNESFSKEDIIDFLNNEELKLALETPRYTRIETTNEINDNENKDSISIEYYDKDKNEYVIKEQTRDDNFLCSVAYVAISAFLYLCVFCLTPNKLIENYDYQKTKIYQEYLESIKFDNLEPKLKIKKENYERLVG